jgi:MFS transporter
MTGRLRQRRILAAAALVDSLGDGLYLAGSALFFTRGLGLSVAETGIGLSVAGILGLAAGAELGRLADRLGPRDIFIALMVIQTLAVGSYVLVTDVAALIVAATVASVCRQGAQAARGGLIGQLGGQDAAGLRAYLHAVINVGIAGGAALAGLAIARDSHSAYVALMLADALTFTVAAAITMLLPRVPVTDRDPSLDKRLALADRRFMALTALSVIISLQFVVSGYLLPLWVVFHTAAPRWLASPLLLLNTAAIVLLQVRVSGRYKGLDRAAGAYRIAGVLLAVACILFGAASYGHSRPLAITLLLAAMLVASAAELYSLAGAFGVSYGLAPAYAIGEYQGVWNLGFGLSVAVGPALLTLVCLRGGAAGWAALGLTMAAAGVIIRLIAARAAKERMVPVRLPAGSDAIAGHRPLRKDLVRRVREAEPSPTPARGGGTDGNSADV